ncbi:MAG: CRISPR-associated protein Cas4 [bacterium]|nr:CRISPR-associated protein Cas4 [bacterium]MDE0239858.1 CRISPR-associated protein Cas4 [bacterium]MDE0417136.1 CRISPR-associated protein Cas4 [bacterium]
MPAATSTIAEEADLAPISALQHMLYCPRQCALIHIERQWAENTYTAEGRVLHQRVDAGGSERRRGVTVERGVPLRSLRLGVFGVSDVIEMHAGGRLYPVEYKRGRPKAHRADEVQLCAQAMCLEEMLETPVPEGALFYGAERRRKTVLFDAELRALTERLASDTRRMLASGKTPPAKHDSRKCGACSLREVCQPLQPGKPDRVNRWLAQVIEM